MSIFRNIGFIVLMALLITVPWFACGLTIWGMYFVGLVALLTLTEWYSVKHSGKTISRIFWEFKNDHPQKAWVIGGSLSVAWGLLMLHLFT